MIDITVEASDDLRGELWGDLKRATAETIRINEKFRGIGGAALLAVPLSELGLKELNRVDPELPPLDSSRDAPLLGPDTVRMGSKPVPVFA